jgi:hypothetical protein
MRTMLYPSEQSPICSDIPITLCFCTQPQVFVRNEGEMKEIEGKQEDDIAYASLPTSVCENSDLHSVHVLCARGGRRTVRGTCWGLSCTAS